MKYYRYKEMLWSEGKLTLMLHEFNVIRETPKGVWIEVWPGKNRFILSQANKHWACPTTEEALESFYARKRRQAGILRAQLAMAEAALQLTKDNEFIYF